MHLTAIVITYNEAEHIAACLATLSFADARLVFDSFSTDETVTLAREAGAQVMQRRFDNFAGQRNAALDAVRAQTDWVLFVDADERIPPELADEIRAALKRDEVVVGWRMPRHNFIFGRQTRGGGWYPDYQTRLLRVDAARYDPAREVHELVLLDGPEGTLHTPMVHFNYRDLAQFIAKQRRYAAYEARILYEAGTRARPHHFLSQPLRHFWWRFVTLKGYRDGWHGLRLCALMGWYEWLKHVHLWRLARA